MAKSSRLYAVMLACLGLGACSSAGQVYAVNEAASRQSAPAITFGNGLAGGTISVVMADGNRLEGQYTLIATPDVGVGCDASCSGGAAAFATGQLRSFPDARPALAVATDGRGGSITCRMAVDRTVHGAGLCRTDRGENYRVTF